MDNNNQYTNGQSGSYSSGQYNGQYSHSYSDIQQKAPTIQFGEGNTVYTSRPSTSGSNRAGNRGGSLFRGIVVGCIVTCIIIGMAGGLVNLLASSDKPDTSDQKTVNIVVAESPVTNNSVDSDSTEPLTYAQIAEKVRRAVVGVNIYTNAYGWGSYIYSQGSGFIISSDGYIVTNSHVIQDEDYAQYSITVNIEAQDGTYTEHEVEVVGFDSRTDLAVLKLKEAVSDLVVAELGNSSALVLGDEVVAIGNPGGSQFAGSITNGIVSGLDRVIDDTSNASSDSAMKYLQTNAAINPGNSGGPLLNMYGHVIGINTAKISADGYEGLGFAIPMATAKPIIEQLIEVGSVVRPVLGITCVEITEQMAAWYDVPVGIMIREISTYSSLGTAGVQVGDIITGCEGEDISSLSELQTIIERFEVGDTVTLSVFRAGSGTFEAEVILVADNSASVQSNNNGGDGSYFNRP